MSAETDEEKIKRGMIRMPWGAWLDGPPCLPQDHNPEPQTVYEDEESPKMGGALPLSCKQHAELDAFLQRIKGPSGASSLSESERKRLQWLLARPEPTTIDPKMILTKRGKAAFT